MRSGPTDNPGSLTAPIPHFWTPKQVAVALTVTPRTVARWIASGALPAHRFARSVRIADADLKEFVAKCRQA
jgi:excisionase family DNA binding protein